MPEKPHPEIKLNQSEITSETVAAWQEQIVNPELDKPPRLELSQVAQAQVANLINKLSQGNRPPAIIAIIRCYNKSKAEMQALQTKLEAMRAQLPELAGVLLAINAEKETAGTASTIESLAAGQIPLIAMAVHEHTWTAGLNGPAALLHAGLKNSPQALAKTEILNLSFDVHIPDSGLERLHAAAANGEPALSVRIEETITNQEHAVIVKEEYEKEIKKLFRKTRELLMNPNISDEERAEAIEIRGTALAVLGRNTNLMVPLADIAKAGGFDPFCNAPGGKRGGMEDHDFLWRLSFASDLQTQQAYRNALQDPVFFEDTAWNAMPMGSVKEKKGRAYKYDHEIEALQAITNRLAHSIQSTDPDQLRVPQSQQDFCF